jgi:hypothetical protein
MSIFYCLKFETPNLEGHVPVFICLRNMGVQLHPQALGSLSSSPTTCRAAVEVFEPASIRRQTWSEFYVTTDGQPVSLSWNKAHIWGLRPDFYYCQTVAGFLIWGALSDGRTGLSFAVAVGSRQRCHSLVRVPWDL